jgi:hypothetical protein
MPDGPGRATPTRPRPSAITAAGRPGEKPAQEPLAAPGRRADGLAPQTPGPLLPDGASCSGRGMSSRTEVLLPSRAEVGDLGISGLTRRFRSRGRNDHEDF